jgi:uncharacterized protein YjiS (DUF1127 family)
MTICQLPATADRHASGHQNWLEWSGLLLARWHTRRVERQILEVMTDRDLRDAGLTRWKVDREASKPFWRD